MISKLPEYSSFVKYKVNDLCIYNGILYKALVDDSTNLPTVSSDWKPLIIGNTSITAIGLVSFFAASVAPSGWLECNGSAISRTQYAELFSVIGTTFGSGDGSTTFNLPDLRGEFIRGYDNNRGVDTDREFGSSQEDMFKTHSHYINTPNFSYPGGTYGWVSGTYYAGKTTSDTGGTETRPRNIALLPCIKYQADISQSVSNPNILINTNGKNPINQRNASGIQTSYGFDRWYGSSNTPSATEEGLRFTITNASTSSSGAIQKVEYPSLYDGKTMTISAKVRASGGDLASLVVANGSVICFSVDFATDGEWHEVSATGTYTYFSLLVCAINISNNSANAYVEFEWIKLEEGSIATPWLIPDPQIELERCKRYYQVFSSYIHSIVTGTNPYLVVFKPQLRTTPTVTVTVGGYSNYSTYGGPANTTNISSLIMPNFTVANAGAYAYFTIKYDAEL